MSARCSFLYIRSSSRDENVGMIDRVFPRWMLAKGEVEMSVVKGKLLAVCTARELYPRKGFVKAVAFRKAIVARKAYRMEFMAG